MSEKWQYQIRLVLRDEAAEIARQRPEDPALSPLTDVLTSHDASLKCQYDAFADYVAAAEREGADNYPLYQWTKDTIENPAKQAKYTKSFTVYVGGQEVYDRKKAEPLAANLLPLVGGEIVARMTQHDTNPANNPQPPSKYRR